MPTSRFRARSRSASSRSCRTTSASRPANSRRPSRCDAQWWRRATRMSSMTSTGDAPPTLPASSEHVLADGLHLLVRPVRPSDRDELQAGYRKLSTRSRHTRFFSPPVDLSDDDLDYLTDLDYRDHCALAAF